MHKLVTFKPIMVIEYDRDIRILNMLLVTDITCPYLELRHPRCVSTN
jgi:hypothetical protein